MGQPRQTSALGTVRPPGERKPCGKEQEQQVSGSRQRDRPGQKPGGGEGLGDGQGGQRRLAQGILLLCGRGPGLTAQWKGSEKGCPMDSLAIMVVTGKAGSQGGRAFPTLVSSRPSIANGLIFLSLSCAGIARLVTNCSGLMDRQNWADPRQGLSLFRTHGSAPEPFSWPGCSLTTTMSLVGLPSFCWPCHDALARMGPKEVG